jgi:hypothetical protein
MSDTDTRAPAIVDVDGLKPRTWVVVAGVGRPASWTLKLDLVRMARERDCMLRNKRISEAGGWR